MKGTPTETRPLEEFNKKLIATAFGEEIKKNHLGLGGEGGIGQIFCCYVVVFGRLINIKTLEIA